MDNSPFLALPCRGSKLICIISFDVALCDQAINARSVEMSATALPKMVPVAFMSVVLIWSTTPLGIVWSSESVHPTMAVLLRMLIALVLGSLIILLMRIRLPWNTTARKLYAVSSIGIVGGMLLSYFAARYLSSGTMSLIFGLSPLISGLLAQKNIG